MINPTLYKIIGEYATKLKYYPNTVDKSDPANREKLILKNMRLAVDLALKYSAKYSLGDDDAEDLIGQGMLGLCTAYDKYKPGKEGFEGKRAKFSSVAFFWVNAAIMSELKKMLDGKTKTNGLDECIPEPPGKDHVKHELLYDGVDERDVMILRMRFGVETGSPMTYHSISELTGLTVGEIKKACGTALEKMRRNAELHGIKWGDVTG